MDGRDVERRDLFLLGGLALAGSLAGCSTRSGDGGSPTATADATPSRG